MKLKMRIMTTLLGLVFGCGIAASQTPRAEQTMNSKRQYIAEVAALTSMGHLDQLRTVLIGGLNSGITVSELKEVMVHSYAYCGFPRARSTSMSMEILLLRYKCSSFISFSTASKSALFFWPVFTRSVFSCRCSSCCLSR